MFGSWHTMAAWTGHVYSSARGSIEEHTGTSNRAAPLMFETGLIRRDSPLSVKSAIFSRCATRKTDFTCAIPEKCATLKQNEPTSKPASKSRTHTRQHYLLQHGFPVKRKVLHEVPPRQAVDVVHGHQRPPELPLPLAVALRGRSAQQRLCQTLQVFGRILRGRGGCLESAGVQSPPEGRRRVLCAALFESFPKKRSKRERVI